ncbi:mitogen-activated kinase kinase kinase 2 [Fagus crenata]
MAMSKPEMVITNLNPGGKKVSVCNNKEPEKVIKSELAAGFGTKPWFNKPKPGTVIPAKKKLVKTMMYEYLANVICPRRSSSSGPNKTSSCFEKNSKAIFPHTP